MAPEELVHLLIEHERPGRVLESGTRRWGVSPTHHREMFPDDCDYVMSDFIDGIDVDVVSDLHDLVEFESDSFDAFYGASVFEHVEFPWVAAQSILRVLRPGGWCYVATHHTFPVHGYPYDYTRWTDMGLSSLFKWAGFDVISSGMSLPCYIIPPPSVAVWDPNAPAYLCVSIIGRKPA